MKRQRSKLEVAARAGYFTGKIAGHASVMLAGAFIAAGVFMDGLLMAVTDGSDYSHLADMTFIPEPGEGQCLYTDTRSHLKVSFVGASDFLTEHMVRKAMPFVDADPLRHIEILPGRLPVLETAPCNVLDVDSPLVYETRAQAMTDLTPAVNKMFERIEELDKEFSRHKAVNWEAEKIELSPPNP